ncbi:MAG: beta-galactosidase [Clostridia bacterium]|nr:beta-galactosidase [Clostridia bacterium]
MIVIRDKDFYINGKAEKLYCGAIHYFRVFKEQWHDRLYKLKCLGFNTVETYCPWNLHEKKEGVFNFSGMLDLVHFIEIATELGLYIIIRPGPYICSECDFGGLPSWLLKNESVAVRSDNAFYLEKSEIYLKEVVDRILPYLHTNGGNIIAVAAENEYGSFGNSRKYMNRCVSILKDLGVDVPIITTDGHTPLLLTGGSADEALACLNFGKGGEILPSHTKTHNEMFPDAPVFHFEHWIGGNNHWGEPYKFYPTEYVVNEVKQQLEKGMSFGFYMFHGGTNFGFFSGANLQGVTIKNRGLTRYISTVTSYDVDAVVNEWGECTPKYFAVQKVMEKHLGKTLPKPLPVKTQNLGDIKLEKSASLFDNLENIGTHFESMLPRNMEHYGQDFGYILYRCTIPANMHINMIGLSNVIDRTHIFFNGIHRGTIYRNDELQYIEPDEWIEEGGTLELLVENMGRVNFGPDIVFGERRGICGYVYVMAPESPRQMLCDWDIYTLPMEDLSKLIFNGNSKLPAFFKGSFKAEEKLDCFVHLDNFTKGFVVVNGFNLGRYWNIGPQLSLYLPAPLLKDENEIIVFEEEAVTEPVVSIRDYHIMNSGAKSQKAAVTGVD